MQGEERGGRTGVRGGDTGSRGQQATCAQGQSGTRPQGGAAPGAPSAQVGCRAGPRFCLLLPIHAVSIQLLARWGEQGTDCGQAQPPFCSLLATDRCPGRLFKPQPPSGVHVLQRRARRGAGAAMRFFPVLRAPGAARAATLLSARPGRPERPCERHCSPRAPVPASRLRPSATASPAEGNTEQTLSDPPEAAGG